VVLNVTGSAFASAVANATIAVSRTPIKDVFIILPIFLIPLFKSVTKN
jgi:hypothetical protein